MNGKIKFPTALSVVIANMIGTGVFTSLGFQLNDISDFAAIIALWTIGGVIALFGAFSYSELGAALPRSGVSTIFSLRYTILRLASFQVGYLPL
jgi:APA family basic amino acid/polyamine antiporter